VVALESTLIAHGLPRPANLETAREAEAAVRAGGAVPATVAVWHGAPTVGLTADQVGHLAEAAGVVKASRRDLGAAVGLRRLAATTVSATMALAHAAGVRVFATGGIGGVHRSSESWDVSADLTELARTPVLVVCAGAKSILDLPRTLEVLETLGVPVIGYRTDEFPAFYVRSRASGGHPSYSPGLAPGADVSRPGASPGLSTQDPGQAPGYMNHAHPPGPPLPVSVRVETPAGAAAVFDAHVRTGGGGAVLAQPCPDDVAVSPDEFDSWLARAEREAAAAGVAGAKVTPFLLARLAELSGGRALAANRALIVANARLAAEVAVALTGRPG
jgi:pseudouridine-5'-phosphate glycosidase